MSTNAPLDEYGLLRQPKWGHLKDLRRSIKLCEAAMVATDPNFTFLSSIVEASVYKSGSLCAVFLMNLGNQSDATVYLSGNSYRLPPCSVSVLPVYKNVALNTAQSTGSGASLSGWAWVNEPVGISSGNAITKTWLVEQINTIADISDYLWYSLRLNVKKDEPFLHDGSQTVLHVESLGDVLHAFLNGKLSGSGKGYTDHSRVTIEVPVTLVPGYNKIDLLSVTVGLQGKTEQLVSTCSQARTLDLTNSLPW